MDMNVPRHSSPDQPARAPDINVHIEKLVLVGVNPHDRSALSSAMQSEMTRLFAERGWPDAPTVNGGIEHLDAGNFHHAGSGRDGEIGAQIGAAVHGGLTR